MGKNKFKKLLKKKIESNFIEYWEKMRSDCIQNEGKLDTYFKHKKNYDYEEYLDMKHQKKYLLTKFRLSNHCLRIETGRHERITNINGKKVILPRNQRLCTYCNLNTIENEIHFLLECPIYQNYRKDIYDYKKNTPMLSL